MGLMHQTLPKYTELIKIQTDLKQLPLWVKVIIDTRLASVEIQASNRVRQAPYISILVLRTILHIENIRTPKKEMHQMNKLRKSWHQIFLLVLHQIVHCMDNQQKRNQGAAVEPKDLVQEVEEQIRQDMDSERRVENHSIIIIFKLILEAIIKIILFGQNEVTLLRLDKSSPIPACKNQKYLHPCTR